MSKKDIKDFTIEELGKELNKIRESSYRASQIFTWIYKKDVHDFEKMDNLPRPLRDKLARLYRSRSLNLKKHLRSSDRTEKFLFGLPDGQLIETVLICSGNRRTICLSTQVGCRYACVFCASGLKGFIRNLTVSEIIEQILFVQGNIAGEITNFVFMGMGEPLDNYENVSRAILIMNSGEGLGIGARRITVSTCGIIPGIERFKHLGIQANLSISLHAANNRLRNSLAPINKKYPLDELIAACKDFIDETNRMITLEYVLIKGRNDSLEDADELSSVAKKLRAKVNLIPYSPVPGKKFQAPPKRQVDIFANRLIRHKVNITVRVSKGKDIHAACGQLAYQLKDVEESRGVW